MSKQVQESWWFLLGLIFIASCNSVAAQASEATSKQPPAKESNATYYGTVFYML
jgi:hypothetical protein